jgi:hypothetical protein
MLYMTSTLLQNPFLLSCRRANVRRPNDAQAKVAAAHHRIALPRDEKRPMDLPGKIIGVPGSEWGSGSGHVLAAEKATIFKCVLRDNTCVHKFLNALSPEKTRQLQPGDGCKLEWQPGARRLERQHLLASTKRF